MTGVVIAPQRQTALLAKQAAEIDLLTNGKFRLGLGIGWNFVEYEALGEDFTNRGRRFEEQIELMRRLWAEPVFDYEGRWHTITAAGINPLPVQRPIPIWIGASAERALRRAAELADGFFPQRPLDGGWPETLAADAHVGRGGGERLVGIRHRAADQRRGPARPTTGARRPTSGASSAPRISRSRPWAASWLGWRAISSGCARRTRCSRDRPRTRSSATPRSTRRRRRSCSSSSTTRRTRRKSGRK